MKNYFHKMKKNEQWTNARNDLSEVNRTINKY